MQLVFFIFWELILNVFSEIDRIFEPKIKSRKIKIVLDTIKKSKWNHQQTKNLIYN